MTRLFSLLAASIIVLSCSCGRMTDIPALPDVIQEATPSVVALITEDGDVYCSGFILKGTGKIATAAHCVEGEYKIDLDWQGHTFSAIVEKYNALDDYALLDPIRINIPVEMGLVISKTEVRSGDTVIVIGHGLGSHEDLTTVGIVSHPHKVMEDNGMNYIMVTSQIVGGFSGSPALNERGEVIGIVSFSLVDATWCSEILPCREQNYYRSPLHGLVPINLVDFSV